MEWKEEIKYLIFVFAFVGSTFFTNAQKEIYIQPGLLTASGTLSPSVMLNRKEVNYYFAGMFEGKFTKNYSARGDIQFLFGNNDSKFLRNNIRVTAGIQYGMPFNNFEWHAGFAPGIALMESNINPSKFEVVPIAQVNIGARFYIWKYFNLFANFAYTHARMNNLVKTNGMADEIRLEAGLGLNLLVKKKQVGN